MAELRPDANRFMEVLRAMWILMFNTNVESDAWLLERLLHDECLRFSELHIVRPNTVV